MNRKVYFGNANKQAWINAPKTGLQANSTGFVASQELLNGRTFIKRSYGAHRTFSPSWNGSLNATDLENSLQTIKDFADGLYGKGPFYWVDPFAKEQNILAPNWAAPALTQYDWKAIFDLDYDSIVATSTNSYNYPAESVRFLNTATPAITPERKFRVIIPEGYSLFFGWHGTQNAGNGTVRIMAYERNTTNSDAIDTEPIAVAAPKLTNTIVDGNIYSMADIYIYKAASSSLDITVAGMVAQIKKSDAEHSTGNFTSGRGTTGLEFASGVNIEYYSSAINDGYIGMSLEWTEI